MNFWKVANRPYDGAPTEGVTPPIFALKMLWGKTLRSHDRGVRYCHQDYWCRYAGLISMGH
jgi:hypothetical protein